MTETPFHPVILDLSGRHYTYADGQTRTDGEAHRQ